MSNYSFEKRKIWLSVGTALIATSMTATSADGLGAFESVSAPATMISVSTATLNEGEGGEGEGGEGEGLAQTDLSSDNAAYLARLGLIRGHLWVGIKLYQEGHIAMAKTHMKHPKDELYAGLEPVFEARGVEGFAKQLAALAAAVNQEQGDEAVDNAYSELLDAIDSSARVETMSAKEALISISQMIRTAADEYAIGVKKGSIVNVHEYQDAYGFTEIAIERLERLTTEQKEGAAEDIERTKQLLLELRALWPKVNPDGYVDGDAASLYGAAARIELMALN
ncbi:hypothetical protein GCM10009123_16700 [Kangiella japonica]|uniref:YfdX protein n=1 Tax=Kangiella japonica TaxID=647384 RepID=A0ABP3CNM0_9GAMM